jgi:hypothetical protein
MLVSQFLERVCTNLALWFLTADSQDEEAYTVLQYQLRVSTPELHTFTSRALPSRALPSRALLSVACPAGCGVSRPD